MRCVLARHPAGSRFLRPPAVVRRASAPTGGDRRDGGRPSGGHNAGGLGRALGCPWPRGGLPHALRTPGVSHPPRNPPSRASGGRGHITLTSRQESATVIGEDSIRGVGASSSTARYRRGDGGASPTTSLQLKDRIVAPISHRGAAEVVCARYYLHAPASAVRLSLGRLQATTGGWPAPPLARSRSRVNGERVSVTVPAQPAATRGRCPQPPWWPALRQRERPFPPQPRRSAARSVRTHPTHGA